MASKPLSGEFAEVLKQFGDEPFSTYDFISEYRALFPRDWEQMQSQYGEGGHGAGRYHTVNTYVAQQLGAAARQGYISRLDYRPAPDGWGNAVIRYWSVGGSDKKETGTSDKAPAIDEEFREGSVRLRTHLRRERHWRLAKLKREAFLREHGKLICERCGLDPEGIYGSPIGSSAIEVHHVNPIAEMKPNTKVELSDLQCLCANCHRVAHAELRTTNQP